eukprot:jgi/Mesvir1/26462/Mv16136-RA.1
MAPYGGGHIVSSRDRTAEFLATVERLQKTHVPYVPAAPSGAPSDSPAHHGLGASRASSATPPQHSHPQSEFAKRASRIGLGIHSTSTKLAKLAKLAKRTAMFDDPAKEIQDLTAVIKKDITALNSAIAELQQLSRMHQDGVHVDNRQSNEHSATVVDNLKTRLMDATKEFKDVLTLRNENLKVHNERRQLFSSSPTSEAPGLGLGKPAAGSAGGAAAKYGASPVKTGLLSRRKGEQQPLLPMHNAPSSSSSGGGGQQLQLQQQQQLIPLADTYLSSRAEALQSVEATIAELSGIFSQLATMVAQQGEIAVRIDENMDDTLANVDNAQTQLLKSTNYQGRVPRA